MAHILEQLKAGELFYVKRNESIKKCLASGEARIQFEESCTVKVKDFSFKDYYLK